MSERVAVIGLGYVGLPVALAFARSFPGTVGFDINRRRVEDLRVGNDRSGETESADLRDVPLRITDDPAALADCTLFVVAVPTGIDHNNKPDLRPLISASETVGRVISPGAVVVYESTVYPGVTEEICGVVVERVSGLVRGKDFTLGYSPERINPGDREHTLERITKVVAGEDDATLERVAAAYGAIIPAGVHRAPSIMVAEAAKVIENTQRDLNIALMNELALIFDRLGIRTRDVLEAAGTKWNFLPFRPGLVGGHCIGIDPYYLTTKAQELGYHPQVILAGRRINDGMGVFLAQRLVKLLVHGDIPVRRSRVGIFGLTFKENVPDMRNSRVPDIVEELQQFGVMPLVHDPIADREEAQAEYGLHLSDYGEMHDLDGLILAVSHRRFLDAGPEELCKCVRPGGVIMDIKSALDPTRLRSDIHYWCL
jgi:UDP-N-acetyl-D-galactosamine dehydrogenase